MKKKDELKQFRDVSVEDLSSRVSNMEEELMNLRFRKASGQLDHTAQLSGLRRSIARAMTVAQEKTAN